MKKILLLISALTFISCVNATSLQSSMPLSINDIHVERVRNEIIRVIKYNTSILPRIDIERIATPKLKLLELKVIDSITLTTGEKLPFNDEISGVFSNKITIKDTTIHIPFEYFPARGDSFLVDCKIEIEETRFSPMNCVRKERPYE